MTDPTTIAPLGAVEATPGERWGGFVFSDDPAYRVPPGEVTPPRKQHVHTTQRACPFEDPGYRRFDTLAGLADFAAGRCPLLEPTALPPEMTLLGTYSVSAEDGDILMAALNYRHAESDAHLEDPDLWISYDTIQAQPVVYPTVPVSLRLGRVALPVRKLTVQGNQGVLLECTGPSDLARELRLRSAVSWFGPDREFWTVQARDVDVPTLIALCNSLRPYVISAAS